MSDNILMILGKSSKQGNIAKRLSQSGYDVTEVETFAQALSHLKQFPEKFSVILIDSTVAAEGTKIFLYNIKTNSAMKGLPVIIEIDHKDPKQIQDDLKVGAYYYLVKPYKEDALLVLVQAAINNWAGIISMRKEISQGVHSLGLMNYGKFHYRTVKECRILAAFLAKACPEPDKAVIGLSEIMINAVEHGNLGISYQEKTQLLACSAWVNEIEKRLALPENSHKQVILVYEKTPKEITITITDEGNGFDWKAYQSVAPERILHSHGRGIAMARLLSFDEVEYSGNGNQVTCTILF